jgi:hypothetical protein
MIVNCKRSKRLRLSACRLERFNLTGWTRSWFGMTFATIAVCFRRNAVTPRHNDHLAYHAAFGSLS